MVISMINLLAYLHSTNGKKEGNLLDQGRLVGKQCEKREKKNWGRSFRADLYHASPFPIFLTVFWAAFNQPDT